MPGDAALVRCDVLVLRQVHVQLLQHGAGEHNGHGAAQDDVHAALVAQHGAQAQAVEQLHARVEPARALQVALVRCHAQRIRSRRKPLQRTAQVLLNAPVPALLALDCEDARRPGLQQLRDVLQASRAQLEFAVNGDHVSAQVPQLLRWRVLWEQAIVEPAP
eukprot:8911787-Lingulodinium_polyedra.AAC.1